MSMKYLGEQFAIHVGGEDLKSTHHPNEIAQSEGVTGKKPFVKTWVHGAFLLVDGGRMGKSLGNAYTVSDLVEKGYDPLALRYFYMTGHYRKQINFTWDGLAAASTALTRLRKIYQSAKADKGRTTLGNEKMEKIERYQEDFRARLSDDLDMPGVLAVVWEVSKSNIPGSDKVELLTEFDRVLGIEIDKGEVKDEKEIPKVVKEMMDEREELRKAKKWDEADKLREKIIERGYKIEDPSA